MYANTVYQATHAIVMDCDGEDDLQKRHTWIVENQDYDIKYCKKRKKIWKAFGLGSLTCFYKLIFRMITGKTIDFGNYCMVSSSIIERISHTSFVHFPAYLLKQKAKSTKIIFNWQKNLSTANPKDGHIRAFYYMPLNQW